MLLQVAKIRLRLSPSIHDWSQGNSHSIAECNMSLELQRCLVQHLTLPEMRLKLKLPDGVHANLCPSDRNLITAVLNTLTSSPTVTITPSSSSGPAGIISAVEHTVDSTQYAVAAAGEDNNFSDAPRVALPDRASLEVTVESGPLLLVLNDCNQASLVRLELSSLNCSASVLPYHTIIDVGGGHLIAHDEYVLTHTIPADGDIKPFCTLLQTNQKSFSCQVQLNSRVTASAALTNSQLTRGLSTEQVQMIEQIAGASDTVIAMDMKDIVLNWNWQSIDAVMKAYVHRASKEQFLSDVNSTPDFTRSEILSDTECAILASKDVTQMHALLAKVQLEMLQVPRKERKALKFKQQVIDQEIALVTASLSSEETPTTTQIDFKLESVALNLNNEVSCQQLLQASISTLDASMCFEPQEQFKLSASLGNLEVIDKSTPDTKHTTVLGLWDSGAPSLLKIDFKALGKQESANVGYSSRLTGHLYTMRLVLVRSTLEPVMEYFTNRMVGPLIGETLVNEDSNEAIYETVDTPAAAPLPMRFDIVIDTPHILVPACASSTDRLELQPGSLRIQNLDSEGALADIFQVNFENTSLEAWRGDQKTTLFDFDMEVNIVRSLAVEGLPEKLAVVVICTEIQLLIQPEITELFRDIIQHNLMQTVATLDLLKSSSDIAVATVSSGAQTPSSNSAFNFELDITMPKLALQCTADLQPLISMHLEATHLALNISNNAIEFTVTSQKFTIQDQTQPNDSDFGQLVHSDEHDSGDQNHQRLAIVFTSSDQANHLSVSLQDLSVEWNHKTLTSVVRLLILEAAEFQKLSAPSNEVMDDATDCTLPPSAAPLETFGVDLSMKRLRVSLNREDMQRKLVLFCLQHATFSMQSESHTSKISTKIGNFEAHFNTHT